MLLVGQEIALSFDFYPTATSRLPKGDTPFGYPRANLESDGVKFTSLREEDAKGGINDLDVIALQLREIAQQSMVTDAKISSFCNELGIEPPF
jgi:hypothetical protein